jgi:hypothetical protein
MGREMALYSFAETVIDPNEKKICMHFIGGKKSEVIPIYHPILVGFAGRGDLEFCLRGRRSRLL